MRLYVQFLTCAEAGAIIGQATSFLLTELGIGVTDLVSQEALSPWTLRKWSLLCPLDIGEWCRVSDMSACVCVCVFVHL